MTRIDVGRGIALEVETTGEGEPLLMIMGIGAQLTMWPDGLVMALVARGFRAIRFDNRDVGLSTWLDHLGVPNVRGLMARRALGRTVRAPYTLSDMAGDVVGLMDALELPRAHVLGVSMGGMIAQTVALEHPDRVRSLTSIMSHGGDLRSLFGRASAMRVLLGPTPTSRDEAVERVARLFRVIGSHRWPVDEALLRERAAANYDRAFHPKGFQRQLTAILASGSRLPALRRLAVPTLVLHGADDPLILSSAGRRVAEAVPGARFVTLDGMGHDLPEPLWDEVADHVAGHCGLLIPSTHDAGDDATPIGIG